MNNRECKTLALPYMTNQQMNRCLKDLCESCEFNTPVHITLYRNGVPPDVVMKFTGHSDYKSMKPYIDITESAKRDAISLMEKAFDAK